jgi:hypothetical protein
MKNLFINLFAAIEAEQNNRLTDFVNHLNECKTIEEVLKQWRFTDLLPKGKKNFTWVSFDQLKNYLLDRRAKYVKKQLAKDLKHLEEVSEAGEVREINISVEWKKNRTWGSNPTAEAQFKGQNNYNRYSSGSIGGCGYDKESTAVANALNQDYSFLKLLYMYKESINFEGKQNRDIFGYGSGYGILPRLEGGVGVSCYPTIFETLGYKWQQVGNGKMYNAYLVSKI